METHPRGLGNLTSQPQYIPSNTLIARYAAPMFRPAIFILASLIVLQTLIKVWDSPLLLKSLLGFSIVIYTLVFIGRMRMKKETEHHFYTPHIQFIRGQASLICVTILILFLAAFGYYNHILWLLYILATLIISEHNSTPVALMTLLEVALVYVLATYLGWGIYTQNWQSPWSFWQANNSLGEHILGIWLITIVFHYLVRNIQGRDRAIAQQEKWRNRITEKWALTDNTSEKRQDLLDVISEITGGMAQLWQPRLLDGMLLDAKGEQAPIQITKASDNNQPVLWLRNRHRHKSEIGGCRLLPDPPPHPDASVQTIFPIRSQDSPHDLLGVLDIVCLQDKVPEYKIKSACHEINGLINDMRLLLINTMQHERQQLLWTLSLNLHHRANVSALCQQVVNDIVGELGFDFATISLVDTNEDLIRGEAECQANWIKNSIHPLSRNTSSREDIQSRTIRQGTTHVNNGKFEPCLDGKIWHKYQHRQFTRVWVAIPDPAISSQYPAVGTIEAGFDLRHRKTIPRDRILLLEQYACHIGLALADARAHQRTRELAEQLTTLQTLSHKMQQASAYFDLQQMIELIGESAKKLLEADIVMIYTLDQETKDIQLVYLTEQALQGNGTLHVSLGADILNYLYTNKCDHFSQEARQDELLVNLKNGRLSRQQRTFTQRQNIKSFAGLPLLDKRQNILGFLCVNYKVRREFHTEFKQIIKLFAAQAAVALEETYSHRLSRRLAISRERNHLKAELHHTLSQNLFGLAQYTNTVYRYAQTGDMVKMIQNLEKLKETTDESRESLHYMLDALEESPNGDTHFVEDLKAYIRRMQLLYPKVTIHFSPTFNEGVPSQIQFYLLRIVIECLNNALRHAQCSHIFITDQTRKFGGIELYIRDDGIGFNVSKARQNGHVGLSTMEHYAQQINSNLSIQSEEECGTQIQVSVPSFTYEAA